MNIPFLGECAILAQRTELLLTTPGSIPKCWFESWILCFQYSTLLLGKQCNTVQALGWVPSNILGAADGVTASCVWPNVGFCSHVGKNK